MIIFGVQVDAAQLTRALRKAPQEFNRSFVRAVHLYLQSFRARMSRERLRGRPGLKRRTGFLAASQKTLVVGNTIGTVVGVYAIGGGVVTYARLQEYGGVVRAVKGRFLAIPIGANLTKAGVARSASPRGIANTFVAKGMIFQKQPAADGGAGAIVPLFALKESVTIPPRLGVRETWANDKARRTAHFGAAIAEAIKRTGLA